MLSWPPSVKFAGLSTQQATQNKLPATPKSKLKSGKLNVCLVGHRVFGTIQSIQCRRLLSGECSVRHTPKPAHALATDMRTQHSVCLTIHTLTS